MDPAVLKQKRFRAALGAVYGLAIGDSIAAKLEFSKKDISERDVRAAMEMPGGGVWKLARGQPTDDTELAIAQVRGFITFSEMEDFTCLALASHLTLEYNRWIASLPFDRDRTLASALSVPLSLSQGEALCLQVYENSKKINIDSLTPGFLPKQVVFAIWLAPAIREAIDRGIIRSVGDIKGDRFDDFMQMVSSIICIDTCLTHPSFVAQFASCMYVLALATLIATFGVDGTDKADNRMAIDVVRTCLSSIHKGCVLHGAKGVLRTWFNDAVDLASPRDLRVNTSESNWELRKLWTTFIWALNHDSRDFQDLVKECLITTEPMSGMGADPFGSSLNSQSRNTKEIGNLYLAPITAIKGALTGMDGLDYNMRCRVSDCFKPLRDRLEYRVDQLYGLVRRVCDVLGDGNVMTIRDIAHLYESFGTVKRFTAWKDVPDVKWIE